MKELVSIIIPAYNSASYISEAVDSALSQTYRDKEIIIVDDGSTDDTLSVLAEYINSQKIRYIKKQNGGPASARNEGIKVARGLFIAFLDADDIWDTYKLAEQVNLFTNPRVGLVYSDMYLKESNSSAALYSESTKGLFRGNVIRDLIRNNFIPTSSVVLRRSAIDTLGYFNEHPQLIAIEDYDMWLRVALLYEVEYSVKPLAWYRIHGGQISHTKYVSIVRNLIFLHLTYLFKDRYRIYIYSSLRKVLYLLRIFIYAKIFLLWSKESIKK